MEELDLGPNGALLYCMEYLIENIDWYQVFFSLFRQIVERFQKSCTRPYDLCLRLTEQLDDYAEDYLIFDCPGQIEIFTHIDVMKSFVSTVQRLGYHICGIFLLDSIFISDSTKFIAGILACLSAMVQLGQYAEWISPRISFVLEVPHINVLSKCDLIASKPSLDRFLDTDLSVILPNLCAKMSGRFRALNQAIGELIDQYSLVSFLPLNPNDEDSITYLLSNVDVAIQYGEDLEPRDDRDLDDVID